MIEALIFDKDGCLFEFDATWSAWANGFLHSLSAAESVPVADLAQAIGFDLDRGRFAQDSLAIAGTPDDIVAALLPHLPGQTKERLAEMVNSSAAEVRPVEAVPLHPLLSRLRAEGYALGLATNDAEVPARAHLRDAGVLDLFARIYGSDTGAGAKPAPGQLLAIAAALKLRPEAVVMVGDSAHDMQAARAAGMSAVAVLTGPATSADLAPLADSVLPDIGHLPDWLAARRS